MQLIWHKGFVTTESLFDAFAHWFDRVWNVDETDVARRISVWFIYAMCRRLVSVCVCRWASDNSTTVGKTSVSLTVQQALWCANTAAAHATRTTTTTMLTILTMRTTEKHYSATRTCRTEYRESRDWRALELRTGRMGNTQPEHWTSHVTRGEYVEIACCACLLRMRMVGLSGFFGALRERRNIVSITTYIIYLSQRWWNKMLSPQSKRMWHVPEINRHVHQELLINNTGRIGVQSVMNLLINKQTERALFQGNVC